ncbi:MAG: hypothetical protein AAB899_02650 [Patescibacteria group bacterium]
MKVVSQISEPQFELEFLSSEWHKDFYDSVRAQFNEIVTNPDISNWEQNYWRKELLWRLRAPLLAQLPFNIQWHVIGLDAGEFEHIRVIREHGWNRTFGERKNLMEVAEAVQKNLPDEWGVNFPQILDMKNNVGRTEFKERIILISSGLTGPYTVLEGNHRAVAFALKKLESEQINHVPKQYILGISPTMSSAYWLNG